MIASYVLVTLVCLLLGYLMVFRKTFCGEDIVTLVEVMMIEMDAAQIEMHNRINDLLTELGATNEQIDMLWALTHEAARKRSSGEIKTPITEQEMDEIRIQSVGYKIHQEMMERGF